MRPRLTAFRSALHGRTLAHEALLEVGERRYREDRKQDRETKRQAAHARHQNK
jgi:hypothetical protein